MLAILETKKFFKQNGNGKATSKQYKKETAEISWALWEKWVWKN